MNEPKPDNQPPQSIVTSEIGYATSVNDYIVWISGLPNVSINEIVISDQKAKGVVISFKHDLVEVLMLDEAKIKPKESFRRTLKQLSVNTTKDLIGRTINPLGQAIDGKSPIPVSQDQSEIEQKPAPIKAREHIKNQFETGIILVDILVPLALGQRELIIGDPHSGKTGFILDTIINQKGKDMICVFALIGKPINEIKNLVDILKTNKAMDYTVVIASSSSERAPLGFLTPQVAVSIAEFFQKQSKDVLLILDDMGIHAKIYREISLLSGKSPGRQSYPGDIFYQHAKLVERAGNFSEKYGGGSITALPIIEVTADDFSSYMATNLMGMTDGHLKFDSVRYHQGIRPSVDIGLSVSRVGRQTQNLAQKNLSDKIKALLAEGKKLESYSRIGSDLSVQTLNTLKQAQQIESILKQTASTKIPILVQMILLGLTFTPFFAQKDVNFVGKFKQTIINFLQTKIDLTKFQPEVEKMKDDAQFIQSLLPLIPALEKECAISVKS